VNKQYVLIYSTTLGIEHYLELPLCYSFLQQTASRSRRMMLRYC